ncbi:hypothetical protein B296_00005166 [Ensete ventricosum]|uniref:Uncharacterized protein n=1 Tax=Ensete ventricosum TaxID=4639 RepID=A0A427ADQ2_ENSVE|nr:hypothetical protein B296_00005166 [Ensete ventricosum]
MAGAGGNNNDTVVCQRYRRKGRRGHRVATSCRGCGRARLERESTTRRLQWKGGHWRCHRLLWSLRGDRMWDGASCCLRMLCKGCCKAMRDRGGCGLSVENEGDGRGSIGGRWRHQVEEEGMCLHEVAIRSKRSCSEDRQWDRCFDTK